MRSFIVFSVIRSYLVENRVACVVFVALNELSNVCCCRWNGSTGEVCQKLKGGFDLVLRRFVCSDELAY